MKTGKHVLLALVLAGIAGCATNNAFVEGKRLIAEGKLDTGLASLEQAARENPDNLEIRAVLARQRFVEAMAILVPRALVLRFFLVPHDLVRL